MAGHATGQPMGAIALAGKWLRRLMGALLALAPNPIDTRALATRALATAPESAGIGDMQGKATPGLGPWAGASPLPGRMLPLPRRRPRRMRRTKGSRPRQEQDRIDAEKQAKDEMEEALRAANHHWGDPETLAGHYAEHGEGVGATSKEEYADMANELYLQQGTVPGKRR